MSNSTPVSNVTKNNGQRRDIEIVIPVLGTDDFDTTLRQLKLALVGCLAEIAVQYKNDLTVLHLLDRKVTEGYDFEGFWSAVLIGAGFKGRTFCITVETPLQLTYTAKKPTDEIVSLSVNRLMERVLERGMPSIESMLVKA